VKADGLEAETPEDCKGQQDGKDDIQLEIVGKKSRSLRPKLGCKAIVVVVVVVVIVVVVVVDVSHL
jgi:t-SNARE complex subunit (syntaxin)